MINSISTIDQALAILRQHLAATRRHSLRDDGSRNTNASGENAAFMQKMDELRHLELPDQRKLNRAVVELVLDREFGSALRNDPQFQQMIEDVTSQLSEDESARAALMKLMK